MQSPRTKTAKFLKDAIQRQMWNNRQRHLCSDTEPHSNSSSSPAAVRTTQEGVFNNEVLNKPPTSQVETQQRTVQQAVNVPIETAEAEPATSTLDREQLDVTQRVTQRVIRAKAAPRYENSLMRGVRLELERARFEQAARRRASESQS